MAAPESKSENKPAAAPPAVKPTEPTAVKPAAAKRPPAAGRPSTRLPERLVSLDAYRGFIMLAMASGGFAVAETVKKHPSLSDRPAWQFLAGQLDHVQWRGCAFWDLIQPAFMFMVGVSMAYSYSKRAARGESYARMLGHALYRSMVLVALGVFLTSNGSKQTDFAFTNVLCQIGLGYTFLFLLWNRPAALQLAAAALILAGDWALFKFYPAPPEDFDSAEYHLPEDWTHLKGAEAHWNKNTNVAAAADRTLLNWFPRKEPFEYSDGGYTTLNFVPSLATMVFGLLAGGLLRSSLGGGAKFAAFVAAGAVLLAAGWALDHYGLCPSVKRIWTPSWALYSTGWTLLMLAVFYCVVDLLGFRRAAVPFVVVGMNSIAVYCASQLIGGWIAQSLVRHLGEGVLTCYGRVDEMFELIVRRVFVLGVIWLACCWAYRQRLFVKI
jgi:predicted acyltransferase